MNLATCFADAAKISLTSRWKLHLIKLKFFACGLRRNPSPRQSETWRYVFHRYDKADLNNETLE
jgi:hypothetical protein